MQQILKNQSTAGLRQVYFDCVDQLDPKTPLQASDMSTFTVKISKNGASAITPTGSTVTEIDATNMKGAFYVALAQGDVDTGGTLEVYITNSAGTKAMLQRKLLVRIRLVDDQDGVHFGLTTLPNAAAGTAGGLPTLGTGAGQINVDGAGAVDANTKKWNGTAVAAPNTAGIPVVDVTKWTGGTVPSPNVTGVPKVDMVDVNGSAAPNLAGGRFDASVGAYQSGQAPLQPTVAGRTLDVSAGGEAGLDWANIGSPTTTVGLTGTTVGLVSSAIDAAQLAVGATGAIASAILAATLDNGISLGNLLRGAVRMMLAKRSGYTSGTVKIRDLANTKDSITIVETDDGWTSVTFNDLT